MDNKNLQKVYESAKKHYSMPDYDTFTKDMQDDGKRRSFYSSMQKEYSMPDYDTFVKDMGFSVNPPITGEETKINQNPQDTISVDQVSLPEKNAQMPRQQLIPQADLVQQSKENVPTPTADNNYMMVGSQRQTEYPKEQPSWWESAYKGLAAGIGRVGGGLLDLANIVSSNRIVSPNTFVDPYTGMQLGRTDVENTIVTPSYQEKLNDKITITKPDGTKKEVYRDPFMRDAKMVEEWANKMSMEARPYFGEKDFIDLLKSGEFGNAFQLGLATATESAPQMLLGSNLLGRVILGTTTAADQYAMLKEEMPDMPEWKRVSSAIGAGFFEQFFEQIGVNPVKWFKTKGYRQGLEEAERWAADLLMSRWKKLGYFGKNFAKSVTEEGLEEVVTSGANDTLNSLLDLIDRDSEGTGIINQYEDAKRVNPNLTIGQFALEKVRSYLNDFIGGAMAGAYMGATARGLGEGYSRIAGQEQRQQNEYVKRAINEQAQSTGQDAYEIAKGVYFGTPESKAVIDRANEMNIEDAITAEVDAISNNGNIISVSDGYGNEGVVVKGNVALTYTDYGKALIDRDNSDEQVYIRNNEGKIIPMAIKDAILQSQYDAEEYKQFQIAREKARYYSQETFNVGDNVYLTSNGEIIRDEAGNPLTSQVTSVGEDGSVNVEVEDVQGNVQEMTMQPEEALESLSPVAYSDGENIYIPKGNRIINNETGEIVQEFETKEEADAFIQGKTDVGEWNAFDIMSENQSENDGAPASEQNVLQENQTEEQQNVIQAEQQIPSYPLTEDGEPDFSQMTSEQSIQVLDELGDQETIDAFIANNLSDAQKSYTKAEKMKPKSTSFQAIKEEQQKIIAEREAAKAKLDLWSSIKSANDYRKLQRTSETLSDARLAEQRQARIEKEKTEKTAEFTGKTTFKESPKIYGNSYTRTLPDGTKIRGKYTIVPAESLIPSHDPNNNWETTEGFPTVDGVNVNDRDYKNDVQARQVTEQMAANYGGQAIENVPVVSSDGVVYDGNGRTIAGQIAAQNGTDAEYIQQLNENAANYGFTPEQISSVNNPRIVLVLDEDLPYNTDTFAKFNAQEKKTQSSTEKSVAAGKRMTESVVNQISDVLDSYSSIESLFGSEKATADLLKVLQDNGIIQPTEIAGLTENGLFSAAGREYITSLVLGSIFSEDAVRRMGNNLSLKNGILRAVPAILENRKLGEYSLIDEINEAITLLYEARANNMALPLYLRQTNAFDETPMDKFSEFSQLLASQLDAGVAKFRELLDLYNNSAKDHIGGQQAIFGEITKEDVKQSIIELYGKRGQNQETGSSETETVNPLQIVQGSEQTEQQSEAAEIKEDVSVDIPIVQYVMQQQNKLSEQVAENISQAESEVNTNPTEAQKEAGNYKKGHVKIDGYDITIEQPKGSTRSGVDENGNKWETKMNNTYGYIRGTQSVDSDHIDVFLSDNPTEGNVYVVDQINQETGEFDEHKVMYGFNSMEEAREAYLSNYSEGWKIGTITEVRKDEFKKWIDSSKRKTKPFSEYSSVNKTAGQNEADVQKSISTSIESTMTDSQKLAFDAISEMLDKAGIPVETLTDEQMNQLANEASLMTVYHGSGAEFDAFDHSHMGEGEGAQAYGWGSYVTEVEEIGRTYAESTSGNIFRSGFGDFYLSEIIKGLAQEKRFDDIKQSLLAHHAEMYKKAGGNTDMYGDFISDYETLQQLKESDLPQRNLYTVEIPDNTGSNYLDWEKEVDRDMSKRLSEQLFNDISGNDTEGSYEEEVEKEMLQRDIEDSFESVRTGKDLYKAISLYIGEEASSKFLSRAGFVGISYPAQYTTGGRSDNARNYVIFNEKDLEIKDRISFMRGYRSRWENSGYTEREDGTKISRNAKEAEDNGTFTEGTFRKMYGVSKKDFNLLVSLGLIKNTEWHHTGKTFKRSDYYSWADSSYSLNGESNYTLTEEGKIDYSNLENSLAQKYLDNKKEISKLSKDFDAKKWEYIQQVEKRNIPSLEEFTERKINKRTDDYLTEEEKKQRAERHNYISTVVAQSGISSFERKQMHENTDTEYRNKANERKAQEIEQIKSEYQKEYQDAYGEDIRYNGEVEKRNMEVEEHNLNANNGKEDVLMQIAGIMGMDNENSRRITEFISHTAKEDEAKQARAEEIKAFNKRVDERIENKKKEIENFIEEGKKSGEITERTRIQSEPRYFVTTKEEMSGKYGWFEASARYNLPRYYSGIEFSNKESYDKYWSMQRELYQIQSEKIYQQAEKSDGIIYGATVGGKIYMNKSALNPETPIHEYTHIWDNACRKNNPELWNRGVELMKQTPVWEEVKNDPNYSDLKTDDEIASEVHSRLTGKDGSRILEDMAEQVKREGTTSEISQTNSLIYKLKNWLSDFWYWVKDTMTPWTKEEASSVSLEDFINMPLKDLAQGRRLDETRFRLPDNFGETATIPINYEYGEGYYADGISGYFVSDKALLDAFRNKYPSYIVTISDDGESLEFEKFTPTIRTRGYRRYANVEYNRTIRTAESLAQELGLDVEIIEDVESLEGKKRYAKGWYDVKTKKIYVVLPNATGSRDVARTILHEGVAHYNLREMLGEDFDLFLDNIYSAANKTIRDRIDSIAEKQGLSRRVATEEYLAMVAEDVTPNDVNTSWFSKVKARFIQLLSKLGINLQGYLTDNDFKYIVWKSYDNLKRKSQMTISEIAKNKQTEQRLLKQTSAEQFAAENSSAYNEIVEEEINNVRYRTVTDPKEIEFLENQPKTKAYRAMQVIDGKLYSPMAAAVDGKLTNPIELNKWEKSEERPDLAKPVIDEKTGEQKKDKNGNLVFGFILDKGIKDATNKKATSVQARYNPYIHASRSPLNDQFKSAWIRPNLVTVEVEIPNSELTSGYKAEKAKDSVGEVEWKSGSVSSILAKKGNPRRVILSRYDKPIRVVKNDEVARMIYEMVGNEIAIPENVVTPQLRVELEKAGVKVGDPEKGVIKTPQLEEAIKRGLLVDNSLLEDTSEIESIIEEAKANGTYMKASNGNPTNLTERQWAQVRTKSFKDWFGDWENDPENASKVVDENGEPRVIDGLYLNIRERNPIKRLDSSINKANNYVNKISEIENETGMKWDDISIFYQEEKAYNLLESIVSQKDYIEILINAIRKGISPSIVVAYRYGEINERERSYNYRDEIFEQGISVVGRAEELNTNTNKYYELFFGEQPYNIVVGVYAGNRGADGEILLTPATKLGLVENIGNIIKSATDNTGEFDPNNPDIRFRMADEAPKTKMDIATESLLKAGARKEAATNVRLHAMKAIGKSLRDINKAIREQAKYSDENVSTLREIVDDLMRIGELSSLDSQDIRYIFSKANQAVTKSDLTEIANGIVDRLMDATNSRIVSIMNKKLAEAKTKKNGKVAKASKMSGYQQITLSKLDEIMKGLSTMDDAKKQYGKVQERYEDSIDEDYRMELDAELEAYEMYFSYLETISPIIDNIKSLNEERDELLQAKKGKRGNEAKSYRETINEIDKAIVENKADLADALTTFVNEIDRIGKEGRENKNDFSKKKKARKELIRKLANFDLSDIPAYTQERVNSELKKMRYWQNSGFANFLFSPLNSLNMYLKLFGRKHAGGKGYLFNYFEPRQRQAMTNKYVGMKQATEELDKASIQFTGMDFNKLSEELHKKSDILITYMDGGKNIERYLTHGQALYLYMINKMSDGAMKLRKMGISEEDIENIASNMDSNVLDFADWIQNDFLPKKRAKYNKVHMDMFGVPMARIENYFPIRIAKGEVEEKQDKDKKKEDLSSTITGSIIKRTPNTKQIDLTSDALSVLYQNIDEMEDWAAYAQLREDFNTLIEYNTFKKRLNNMKSVHGAGDKLYDNFVSAIKTAVNKDTSVNARENKFFKNVSRGTTVASLNFNLNPAIKQLLGYPAIFGEADLKDVIKNTINPYGAFKWAMENLPLFEERVSGGNAGWTQLELDKESSWEVWNKKYVEWATKIGMAPNRFMDAIVCATTAKAAYDTSLRRYKKWGFKNPEEKALADAERAYNETQPSSQGLYISPMQRSNNVADIIFSLFRNANFAFYRRLVEAVRNLSRVSSKDRYNKILSSTAHRLELEEGMTKEQSEKVAREMTNKQIAKDSISLVLFGYVMNTLWSLGSNWAYLLAGDDDDEKKKMIKDALIVGLLSPITGIPLFGSFAEDWMWSALRGSYYDSTLLSTPLTDEIERTASNAYKLAKSISKDDDRRTLFIAAEFAKSLVNLCIKTGTGINPDLLTNMVYGVINAAQSDFDSVSDFRDLILTIINAPAESREKLIIDELGITEEGLNESLSQGEITEIYDKFVDRRIERQKGILAPFAKEDYQTIKTAGKEFKKQVRERVELKQEDNGKD